jgi:hypothetical protein
MPVTEEDEARAVDELAGLWAGGGGEANTVDAVGLAGLSGPLPEMLLRDETGPGAVQEKVALRERINLGNRARSISSTPSPILVGQRRTSASGKYCSSKCRMPGV